MVQVMETFPVTKNGKFFGYADAKQIARSNGVLKIFDAAKAEAMAMKAKVEEQAGADADAKVQMEAARQRQAKPSDVKKAPTRDGD